MSELDILPILLSEEALNDPLLSKSPKRFDIVSGHQKSTLNLPPDCILLGSSARCPIHIFKIKHAPVYAFQGHPEITRQDLKERVDPYRDKYFKTTEEYEDFINSKKDTCEANKLLYRFIDLISHQMI